MPEKILVVEDERNVGSTLVERLGAEGFDVTWAKNLEESREAIATGKFDLALLDVGLPDGSGFALAELLREVSRPTAIIFLTAFTSHEDRIRGLELGAEDYVTKPFHLKELLLRIRKGLRRARYFSDLSGSADESIAVGRALVNFAKFTAEVDGQVHSLTHKECEVLKLLVDRSGKVVSRDEILNQAWSENEFPSSRTVDNFIMKLRRLVEPDPENPQIIRSVRGVGYQLEEKEDKK